MLTLTKGRKLVKLARKSIDSHFSKKELNFSQEKKEFSQMQGCFVTLYKNKVLRGCVGYPYPIKKLAEAVVDSAKSAAFSDVRFEPLKKDELDKIKIEISVLTKPELIHERNELPSAIKVGKDGLIVSFSGFSGLLLPQVATEHKLNALEFLRATCAKAGLPPETWLNPLCNIYKFQAQIFSETKPKGRVAETKH